LPVSAASIRAAAQPTPLSTEIAPTGQLTMQAPHSMQSSGFARTAASSPATNTPCGQTMEHMPQLEQLSSLYSKVLIAFVVIIVQVGAAVLVVFQGVDRVCRDHSAIPRRPAIRKATASNKPQASEIAMSGRNLKISSYTTREPI